MRDLKSNRPLFNLLMRELRDHHTLTTAMNEGLNENKRGRLVYRHRNLGVICPNHICTSRYTTYSYGCTGNPNCLHNHSSIYFIQQCGDEWLLGHSFPHARQRMNLVHRYISNDKMYDFTHRGSQIRLRGSQYSYGTIESIYFNGLGFGV